MIDRRMLKTRQAIQDALFSLMQEKQYNRITIQDIIDRANVGRSTFYSHFATKDELLLSSIEGLLSMLDQCIMDYLGHAGENARLLPVGELFEHIRDNSRVMKGLIKGKSSDLFLEKAQAYWNKKIEGYLEQKLTGEKQPAGKVEDGKLTDGKTDGTAARKVEDGKTDGTAAGKVTGAGKAVGIPMPILANHISGTLINLLRWWVENRMPYSPFEMDEYFQKLITPCLDAAIDIRAGT